MGTDRPGQSGDKLQSCTLVPPGKGRELGFTLQAEGASVKSCAQDWSHRCTFETSFWSWFPTSSFSLYGLFSPGFGYCRHQSRAVLATGFSATLLNRQSLTDLPPTALSLAKDHFMAKANETSSVPWGVEKIPREAHSLLQITCQESFKQLLRILCACS